MATELEYGNAKIGALEALAKFLNAAAALVGFFQTELERERDRENAADAASQGKK